MLTVPEADRVSWEPVQYTVLTALSGYSRRVNPAVWISLCPLLSTMVLSPFLGEDREPVREPARWRGRSVGGGPGGASAPALLGWKLDLGERGGAAGE